jgi:diacylglycerol kinase family enzyme
MGSPTAAGAGGTGTLPAQPGGGWVAVAANAYAGRGAGRGHVDRLVAALAREGLATRVAWTLDERDTLLAQADADPSCRALVVAGGDGTVAAVLDGRPAVPVAVLPVGTENLFARHFRFRRRPEALARTIAEGRAWPLDLGLAAGRSFALMAGFGFDADVVTRHHRARVGDGGTPRPTNRAAYVAPLLQASLAYRFGPLTVRVDDPGPAETLEGTTVFVFNLPRYALGLPFAPDARGDDGLLDLVVFERPGALNAAHYLWLVLRGLHLRRRGVHHRRARRVTIAAAEAVPVQLDGDPGGTVEPGAPWTVAVVPGAVRVLVPASYVAAQD